jgi:hypothetical protein
VGRVIFHFVCSVFVDIVVGRIMRRAAVCSGFLYFCVGTGLPWRALLMLLHTDVAVCTLTYTL